MSHLGRIDSLIHYTSMPDLPVELWAMVSRLLVKRSPRDTVTYQNDLCAVARVNSNANLAASTLLYKRIQVIDFESLFEGFDHHPDSIRPSKTHWLSTITSMRVAFSYYDITPLMGPVMQRFLVGYHHHGSLAEFLPKLSKLQLLSVLNSPAKYPEPTSLMPRWSLHSLPAKHICQTVYKRQDQNFFLTDRPSPATMMMHRPDKGRRRAFREPIGNTGGRIILSLQYPFWRSIIYTRHLPMDDPVLWEYFIDRISELLRSMIDYEEWAPEDTVFEVYGWLDKCLHYHPPGSPCDCQREREQISRIANQKQYHLDPQDDLSSDIISIKVKFGMPDERPTCRVCGRQ